MDGGGGWMDGWMGDDGWMGKNKKLYRSCMAMYVYVCNVFNYIIINK